MERSCLSRSRSHAASGVLVTRTVAQLLRYGTFLTLSFRVPVAVEAAAKNLNRDRSRVEPESTVSNLVNLYKDPIPINPYRRAGAATLYLGRRRERIFWQRRY